MRYFFLYFCCFLFFPFNLRPQENVPDSVAMPIFGINSKGQLVTWEKKFAVVVITPEDQFNEMKLKYKNSKLIHLKDSDECFGSLPRFLRMFVGCKEPTLESKAGNFIAFFDFQPDSTQWDSLEIKQIKKQFREINKVTNPYILGIRRDLAISFDKQLNTIPLDEIEKYIEYKPSDYAKKVFNADQVISYPILLGGEYFREKYNYCNVLLFYKEKAGYFLLYCFYTDKGYKERDKYNKALEKMLRFKD